MKVTVEFLSLPKITRIIGSKSITLVFQGQNIESVINEIIGRYGEEVSHFLLDDSGKLDMTLKVLVNKKEWIPRNRLDKSIKDGDLITIMMLVGGG